VNIAEDGWRPASHWNARACAPGVFDQVIKLKRKRAQAVSPAEKPVTSFPENAEASFVVAFSAENW
jgi:hypothetical protein